MATRDSKPYLATKSSKKFLAMEKSFDNSKASTMMHKVSR
jgi:hypothetical protein